MSKTTIFLVLLFWAVFAAFAFHGHWIVGAIAGAVVVIWALDLMVRRDQELEEAKREAEEQKRLLEYERLIAASEALSRTGDHFKNDGPKWTVKKHDWAVWDANYPLTLGSVENCGGFDPTLKPYEGAGK